MAQTKENDCALDHIGLSKNQNKINYHEEETKKTALLY